MQHKDNIDDPIYKGNDIVDSDFEEETPISYESDREIAAKFDARVKYIAQNYQYIPTMGSKRLDGVFYEWKVTFEVVNPKVHNNPTNIKEILFSVGENKRWDSMMDGIPLRLIPFELFDYIERCVKDNVSRKSNKNWFLDPEIGTKIDTDHERDVSNSRLARWLHNYNHPHRTHTGLADAFSLVYQDRVRYNWSTSRWMIYNGKFWATDSDGHMFRLFDDLLCRMLSLTEEEVENVVEKREFQKWVLKMEDARNIKSSMELTKSKLPVLHENLDSDPMLFNCENGTINLRTGEIIPHSSDDLISKICHVEYEPDANIKNEKWERFLADSIQTEKTRDFLQRAVGYSLTGCTNEEALFFLHGPPMTGKSSFLEAVLQVFGAYGKTSNFSTFLTRRDNTGPNESIARLANVRLVQCNEVNKDTTFNSALIKNLVSGDTKNARFPFARDSFDFEPIFKLWLASNYRPNINYDDDAMWRRFFVVPFIQEVSDEKKDKNLKSILKHDDEIQKAILSWAVEGCVKWCRDENLYPPEEVITASKEYKQAQSPLYHWMQDTCMLKDDAKETTQPLYDSYLQWRRSANTKEPTSITIFRKQLKEYGFQSKHIADGTAWLGIRLLGEFEMLDGTFDDFDDDNNDKRELEDKIKTRMAKEREVTLKKEQQEAERTEKRKKANQYTNEYGDPNNDYKLPEEPLNVEKQEAKAKAEATRSDHTYDENFVYTPPALPVLEGKNYDFERMRQVLWDHVEKQTHEVKKAGKKFTREYLIKKVTFEISLDRPDIPKDVWQEYLIKLMDNDAHMQVEVMNVCESNIKVENGTEEEDWWANHMKEWKELKEKR